ncbi:MAG: hypothetical protein ACE5JG_07335, partial [Planctomycetota bacterium]
MARKDPPAPGIDTLLPDVRRSLEAELHRGLDELEVVRGEDRRYSRVWELRASSGGRRRRFLLKWSSRGCSRELELVLLTRELFAANPLVRAPAVACTPSEDTFLVEHLPGRSLASVWSKPPLFGFGTWLTGVEARFRETGRWLAVFHEATRTSEPVTWEGLREYVRVRAEALPLLPSGLADRLWASLGRAGRGTTVRVHGDFS